jgi:hypothetical protein
LVQLFGPSKDWKKTSSPGSPHEDEFEKFCGVFAKAVGAQSANAVKMQIRFALPEKRGSSWGRQAQTAILNKAAALEMGFIEDNQLPDLKAVGRGT